MEADISIWQKPGHFYFALTRTGNAFGLSTDKRPIVHVYSSCRLREQIRSCHLRIAGD
jgi:hypothetical protein